MPENASAANARSKRRAPKQQRSRNTVECIKQATMEIITNEGFPAATTAHIAERAGVSVGSLYQYFTTREAILLTLYEDLSIHLAGEMKKLAIKLLDVPLDRAVRLATSQMLAWHEQHRLILLDLVAEMPELALASHPVSYDNLMHGTIKAFVHDRTAYKSVQEVERVVFFLERIIVESIRSYVWLHPRISKRAFIDEIARILVPYLSHTQ